MFRRVKISMQTPLSDSPKPSRKSSCRSRPSKIKISVRNCTCAIQSNKYTPSHGRRNQSLAPFISTAQMASMYDIKRFKVEFKNWNSPDNAGMITKSDGTQASSQGGRRCLPGDPQPRVDVDFRTSMTCGAVSGCCTGQGDSHVALCLGAAVLHRPGGECPFLRAWQAVCFP